MFQNRLALALGNQNVGGSSALLTNLISYWKLDESSTGASPVTRLDSVLASANDLTDNNTVPSAAGKISNAINPAQVNLEFLSHVNNASLQVGDIDYSLSAWVQTTDLADTACILGKADSGASGPYVLRTGPTNVLRAQLTVNDGVSFGNVIADTFGNLSTSTWYFIVMWHDSIANQIGISVNDVADTFAWSTGTKVETNGFSIGRPGEFSGQYWNGLVDEVGFWKKVLSPAERTNLYNGGAGLSYPF